MYEEPPTSTMFIRCGSGKTPKKSVLLFHKPFHKSRQCCRHRQTVGLLLMGQADNYKCYKQLADLNNLKQSGILDEEEYLKERGAIMEMLMKLK